MVSFFDVTSKHKKTLFLSLHYQCSTGKLHVVDEMCVMAFSEDLAYWGIDEIYLETCCQNKFNLRKEYIEEEIKKELLNIKQEEPDIFPETKCGNYMRFIWDLMEKSETSFAARIVSFLSMYCMSSRILTIITIYFHKTLLLRGCQVDFLLSHHWKLLPLRKFYTKKISWKNS